MCTRDSENIVTRAILSVGLLSRLRTVVYALFCTRYTKMSGADPNIFGASVHVIFAGSLALSCFVNETLQFEATFCHVSRKIPDSFGNIEKVGSLS